MDELIPLEEAIYDYQQAGEDYLKKVEEAENFFKIDRQIFESILRTHFNASEVYVSGNEVKLIRYGYEELPEEVEEFLKTRKYIHKYIDKFKEEITFNID